MLVISLSCSKKKHNADDKETKIYMTHLIDLDKAFCRTPKKIIRRFLKGEICP